MSYIKIMPLDQPNLGLQQGVKINLFTVELFEKFKNI